MGQLVQTPANAPNGGPLALAGVESPTQKMNLTQDG